MSETETRVEHKFPEKIKIPDTLKDEIVSGLRIAKNKILEYSPQVVIVPLRSARLLVAPLIKHFKDEGETEIPKFVEAAIGKIIPAIWTDDMITDFLMNEDLAEDSDVQDYPGLFHQWITKHGNQVVEPIVSQLREGTDGQEISTVFILDDAPGTGETLSFTAPEIIYSAYGDDIQISTQNVLSSGVNWESQIIQENFPDEEMGPVKHFLKELTKGQLDSRQLIREGQFIADVEERKWFMDEVKKRSSKESPMIEISDKDTLRLLEDITWQFYTGEKKVKIVEVLCKKYGQDNLLKLSKMVFSSIEDLSGKI